jgi:hypothetical protein
LLTELVSKNVLTGERYLTEKIDGTFEESQTVSKFFGIKPKKLTGTHLFKYYIKHRN